MITLKHTRNPAWEETTRSVVSPAWRRIQAPALAIYNLVARPEDLYPWFATMDSATRDMAARYTAYSYGWEKQQDEYFRRQTPHGQVLDLLNSRHFVFTANEREVEQAMREFYQRN